MHDIREHQTVEGVIEGTFSHEDIDRAVLVTHDGKHNMIVTMYWSGEEFQAPSLIEALYLAYGPDCCCDEYEYSL